MTGWNGTRGYLAPLKFTAGDNEDMLKLWRKGYSTFDIACEKCWPECEVANHMPYVLARAREDAEWNAHDDLSKSIEVCYEAIRARKAAGGPGWP